MFMQWQEGSLAFTKYCSSSCQKLPSLTRTDSWCLHNDDGSNNWEWSCDYLSALNMRSDWFFLVFITFWQMIHYYILQTKRNKKAMLWQGSHTYHAIVTLDMYQNLQRHRTVLPVIAQLSCITASSAVHIWLQWQKTYLSIIDIKMVHRNVSGTSLWSTV